MKPPKDWIEGDNLTLDIEIIKKKQEIVKEYEKIKKLRSDIDYLESLKINK